MAKAETKGAAKEQQNVSADNVVEKLMKGNLVTDIADKAAVTGACLLAQRKLLQETN